MRWISVGVESHIVQLFILFIPHLNTCSSPDGMEVATKGKGILGAACILYAYYTIWVLGTVRGGMHVKCVYVNGP